jgi:hypothetical protein
VAVFPYTFWVVTKGQVFSSVHTHKQRRPILRIYNIHFSMVNFKDVNMSDYIAQMVKKNLRTGN